MTASAGGNRAIRCSGSSREWRSPIFACRHFLKFALLQLLFFSCLLLLSTNCSKSSASSVPAASVQSTSVNSASSQNASSSLLVSSSSTERRPRRRRFYYELLDADGRQLAEDEEEDDDNDDNDDDDDDDEEEEDDRSVGEEERRPKQRRKKSRRAFGQSDYLLPENFRSLRRKDIPVTYRLHDDLLRYYRKGTRPVTHPSKIISVSMSVFLYQIIKLDAVKNTISLSGSFELYWQDEFLQWEPDTYEGSTEIFLASTDIWTPEFSLYYSVNFNDAVKLQSNNDVRVNYTGHVRYWIPFSTESLCNNMDVKFFPFDTQRCTLLLGSWAHSNDSIKYSLYSKNLSLVDFYDNQEWQLDLRQSHITSDGFLYDYLDPPLFWEMIVIDLVVARQSFYYVFNLVIPSAMITFVAVIGFHTPSSSGKNRDAKFRQGIMTLMSMSMILLAIVQDMPKFSMSERKGRGSFSGIPLIGLYYFMLLVIVSFSTVTTSMFVYMERNVRIHRKIPFYLRWMIALERTKKQLSKRYSFRTRPKRRAPTATDLLETSEAIIASHGHLNGSVGAGLGAASSADDRQNLLLNSRQQNQAGGTMTAASKQTTQNVAMSLLRLISCDKEQRGTSTPQSGRQREEKAIGTGIGSSRGGGKAASSSKELRHGSRAEEKRERDGEGGGGEHRSRDASTGSQHRQPSPMPTRKRHSLLAADSLMVHQSFLLESMAQTFAQLTGLVQAIRQDLSTLVPQNDDLDGDWQKAIRRLELCSLTFYISLLMGTMLLFFYHDWYCYIGYNPCGQQNLKCPWLAADASSPACLT